MAQATYNESKFIFRDKSKLRFFLGISLSILVLSLLMDIRPVMFLAAFCIAGSFFMIYERYVQMPVDFELFTFFTILMTLKFGLFWGMFTGVATKMSAVFYNKDFNRNTLFSLSAYVVAAILTSFLNQIITNVIALGLIVALMTNVYTFFIFSTIVQMEKMELFMYGGSNFLFNVVMVMGFSQFFVSLMALI